MRRTRRIGVLALLALAAAAALLAACGAGDDPDQPIEVVATTTWLADIAQNVAGERLTVESVVPVGADPHAFEPTPSDITAVATSDLLVVNGGGLESALLQTLDDAGGDVTTVVASQGLTPRTPGPREPAAESDGGGSPDTGQDEVDAHYWLDPVSVVTYVENIRDALVAADPDGAAGYRANAAAYIGELRALDEQIRAEVAALPAADRLLVTNHASHGYFADRYGFEVVGAVIPAMSTDATPSARELADLVATIRETGARAVFVEAGESPQLAEQVAAETGVAVETRLLDHSLTEADGPAPTYLDMMRYDTSLIVDALREP